MKNRAGRNNYYARRIDWDNWCGSYRVQLVQESVTENYEVKQQVFKALDAHTDADVILASSSSGLLMTPIQQVTNHPGRCLIAHPFNPPHLIPLVELVPGDGADDQTISNMNN